MRLLDLFCGSGGAAMGYHRAGFEVVGVDNQPMPRFPFEFHQADAFEFLEAHGHEFDAIHASPPCQAYTALKGMWNAREGHLDLIPQTRAMLQSASKPYVIENVPGAPLDVGLMLCGSMFGLGCGIAELRRHRLFESNILLFSPGHCNHGIYGEHARDRRRTISVVGDHPRDPQLERKRYRTVTVTESASQQNVAQNQIRETFSVNQAQEAMGIGWMPIRELSQAIPPAYTEWIGKQLLNSLDKSTAIAS